MGSSILSKHKLRKLETFNIGGTQCEKVPTYYKTWSWFLRRNYHFFCEINVTTKELIWRFFFFWVIMLFSTYFSTNRVRKLPFCCKNSVKLKMALPLKLLRQNVMYIHPWTEVVYQNLESKNDLFYIFDSTGSVFENSEKPLF